MIRWYRNNEPIKKTKYFEMSQNKGEAILRITKCYQDDVAEYKCEATNPAGKATSVANLLLQRKYSYCLLYILYNIYKICYTSN